MKLTLLGDVLNIQNFSSGATPQNKLNSDQFFYMEGFMEHYVVITTLSDQHTANIVCNALESSGVAVMIEHMHVHESSVHGVAYRVLVPFQHSQLALRTLSGLGITHKDSSGVWSNAA